VIEHYITTADPTSQYPEALAGEAAWQIVEQFGIPTAYLHLVFAAHAAAQPSPWQGLFRLQGSDLIKTLGMERRTDVPKPEKLKELAKAISQKGRCLTGVDSRSKRPSKFISVDEQPNHEIVHVLRLGEAQRAAYQALDPGPQLDMFALNFLGVFLADLMLLGIEMPLIGPPTIGGKLRDAKRCPQLLKLQEDVILSPAEHIGPDLPRLRINGVPPPAWVRFAAYVTPHVVQL
jgi:hypothetical protein